MGFGETLECGERNPGQLGIAGGDHARASAAVADERDFPDRLSPRDLADYLLVPSLPVVDRPKAPSPHNIEAVTRIALPEQDLAPL